ncbi:unnamed protein product, partial [Amoebophrya sp. A120]|eukprot:GSA120T00006872001.1
MGSVRVAGERGEERTGEPAALVCVCQPRGGARRAGTYNVKTRGERGRGYRFHPSEFDDEWRSEPCAHPARPWGLSCRRRQPRAQLRPPKRKDAAAHSWTSKAPPLRALDRQIPGRRRAWGDLAHGSESGAARKHEGGRNGARLFLVGLMWGRVAWDVGELPRTKEAGAAHCYRGAP